MEANHLQVIRKDYGHAKTVLDKIEAAITDLGWLAAMRVAEFRRPQAERELLYGTNGMSAHALLSALLGNADADVGGSLAEWFASMEQRAPGFRNSLTHAVLMFPKVFTAESAQSHFRLCLEAAHHLTALRNRLAVENTEAERVCCEAATAAARIAGLRDFAG